MDEKQLQEAIDGMIGQRPKLVLERPRETRAGMGLFEASQRGGRESFYTKNAKLEHRSGTSDLSESTDDGLKKFMEFAGKLVKTTGDVLKSDKHGVYVRLYREWKRSGGKKAKSLYAFVNPSTGDILRGVAWDDPGRKVAGNVNKPRTWKRSWTERVS